MRITTKLVVLITICLFYLNPARACTPLNTPGLISQTITPTQLLLDFQTTTVWTNCQNYLVVEIACDAAAYTGAANATYSSSAILFTSTPMNLPTMTINISNFCPGAYKFRAREASVQIPGQTSSWSANGTFTVPGTYVPPTLSVTAALPNICPPQSNTLSAIIGNGCGGSSNLYQWTPTTGLSCPTCSTTLANPTVTTNYTVTVTGGQIGCWTQTAAISVVIAPVQAVFGPINAVPSSICAGQTTTVSMLYYNSGLITWQSAPSASGPWTNVPNSNNFSYVFGPLQSSTYFRAEVVGCQTVDYTNVVFVNVNPNPTVSAVASTVCPGQTSTLTGSGATAYSWSSPAYPTGANTGGANPLVTTTYTVTGNLAGCTGTALVTVTVNPAPNLAVNNLTVCNNQTFTLQGIGASTWYWQGPLSFTSNAQSPVLTNATPAMSGNYTLTGTSPLGCPGSTVANILVQAVPTPSIAQSTPVCLNGPLFLYGSNVTGYSWSGPNSFSSVLQNPVINNVTAAAAGVYTLVGTVGTCTGSVTRSITVSPLPSPTITTNSPVCAGQSIYFSATGATSYTWSGPPAFYVTGPTPSIPNAAANNNGVFTLTARGANSCTAAATTTVVVNPLPVIPVTNLTVCTNQAINLTSGGGVTYTWTGPGSFASNAQNPSIAGAQVNMTGLYNTTVVTAAGCSNTAVTTVTVLTLPPAAITVNTPSLCATHSLQLIASGGNSYSWSGPGGFASLQSSPQITNITTAYSGVYTLSATIGQCTGTTTANITVFPLPSPTLSATSPVCEYQVMQLNAGNGIGYTYFWQGPDNFSHYGNNYVFSSVPLTAQGVYTLTTTDLNGCKSTSLTTALINPIPIIETRNVASCEGQPAFLLSNGGVSYVWKGPNNFLASTGNATVPVVNNLTAGVYTVIVTSAASCTSMATALVSVKALPIPSLIVTPKACVNGTVNLSGFGGAAYQWDGPNDFASTYQNTTFTATSISCNGIYTLTVKDAAGCTSYTTAPVEVYNLPDGMLLSDNDKRCVPFCCTFNLKNTSNAPVVDYKWTLNGRNYNQPTFDYCFLTAGDYLVRGAFIDANGCTNATTYTINAHPVPTADFLFTPPKPVEMLEEVEFTEMASGPELVQWNWYFISNRDLKVPGRKAVYRFENAGTYPVAMVVKNTWGCADTIVKAVVIAEDFSLFVPNAFTPNDDGDNDQFFAKGRGVVKFDLRIYDRWGGLVFQTNDFSGAWDGTLNGKPCQSDVYVWEIVASSADGKTKELSGHVSLYR